MESASSNRRAPVSPSEFMRQRRPELFSDSINVSELILERDRLEHYLETLTARNEEKVFEHYCRELCERTICPALIPQTGPTGGGDAKVDTENHPVAETIAARWYVGNADTAATKRFAFAFSAKKDWASKIGTDVASAVSTERGYAHIYFVTNQAVSDKKRASVQDALTKKHGIAVTVLDRNWLVEKSLDPKNIEVVATKLGLKDLERQRRKTQGPEDHARLQRLEELERHIADPKRYRGATYQLVEDCIEAALLVRGLGSPRDEVDSRFDRAERLAVGMRAQLFHIQYLRAWSLYWWFDDIAAIRMALPRLSQEYLGEATAWEIELLVNLWVAAQGSRHADSARLSEDFCRAECDVKAALARIAGKKGQPTQAAWAETLGLFMELTIARVEGQPLEPSLRQLRRTLNRTRDLPEYPIESLLNWLSAIIEVVPPNKELLQIAEEMASVQSKRSSVASRVDVFLQVSVQYLKTGDPYSALQQLGKAQVELKRYNSIEYQAMVWQTCARAYAKAGLGWAARSCVLASAQVSFGKFAREGKVPSSALPLVWQLVWLDLRLGQGAVALEWLALFDALSGSTVTGAEEVDQVTKDRLAIEAAFATAALRTPLVNLSASPWLPRVLEEFELHFASAAALVAQGYEEELSVEVGSTTDEVLKTMRLLLDHPVARDLPEEFDWRSSPRIPLSTRLLGVAIRLDVTAQSDALRFAEGFLGFLEALFATGLGRDVVGIRESMDIRVNQSESDTLQWRVTEDEYGESTFDILVPAGALGPTKNDLNNWIRLALTLFAEIGHAADQDAFRRLLMTGDAGLDRATSLAHVPVTLDSMLGRSYPAPPVWPVPVPEAELRPYRRTTSLIESLPAPTATQRQEETRVPGDMVKHREVAIPGLIYAHLWDKARWRGISFLTAPARAPIMGLLFSDFDAGRKIFKGLRHRLGDVDRENRLLVALLTGIDRRNPAHYRAALTANIEVLKKKTGEEQVWMDIARSNTMEPKTEENLKRFLDAYRAEGRYLLAPAHMRPGTSPEFDSALGIMKTDLGVAPAWTVGPDSELVLALRRNDSPIIPLDQPNAPVQTALAMLRGEFKPRHDAPFRWPGTPEHQ